MSRQAGPSIVLSVLIVCFFAVALFQRDSPRTRARGVRPQTRESVARTSPPAPVERTRTAQASDQVRTSRTPGPAGKSSVTRESIGLQKRRSRTFRDGAAGSDESTRGQRELGRPRHTARIGQVTGSCRHRRERPGERRSKSRRGPGKRQLRRRNGPIGVHDGARHRRRSRMSRLGFMAPANTATCSGGPIATPYRSGIRRCRRECSCERRAFDEFGHLNLFQIFATSVRLKA